MLRFCFCFSWDTPNKDLLCSLLKSDTQQAPCLVEFVASLVTTAVPAPLVEEEVVGEEEGVVIGPAVVAVDVQRQPQQGE